MADHLGQLLLQEGGEVKVPGTQPGQPTEVLTVTSGAATACASEAEAASQAAHKAAAGSTGQAAAAGGTAVRAAAPPPSVVIPSPAAQQALQAAMADCHSRLHRAVHRSQAVTLSLYKPTPPGAAIAGAALALVRQYVGEALERHARLTPEQVHQLETVADCVHALASWRDAAARSQDEGLQCLLSDAVLLALADAAAAKIAPDSGNMRGRHQSISRQQLLDWLAAELDQQQPAAAEATAEGTVGRSEGGDSEVISTSSSSSCGCFPLVLQQQAGTVAELLSDAAAGQRPWVCAEVQELLQAAAAGGLHGAGGSTGGRPHRRTDPAAYRQRLAERFSCKSTVGHRCMMSWRWLIDTFWLLCR